MRPRRRGTALSHGLLMDVFPAGRLAAPCCSLAASLLLPCCYLEAARRLTNTCFNMEKSPIVGDFLAKNFVFSV
jgi:hypothetical protein